MLLQLHGESNLVNREVLSDQHYIIRAKGRAKILSANHKKLRGNY
nr:MAG TPA: hypothetical protein [Caudoviricetes sp.]